MDAERVGEVGLRRRARVGEQVEDAELLSAEAELVKRAGERAVRGPGQAREQQAAARLRRGGARAGRSPGDS